MKYKRRQYVVNPKIQGLAALIFCATGSVGLMLFAVMANGILTRLGAQYPNVEAAFLSDMQSGLRQSAVIAFFAVLPLSAAVGILFTFRIVGPLYRMGEHLKSISRGADPGICRIRKTDELHDFLALLNNAISSLQARLREASGEEEQLPAAEASEHKKAA